MQAAIQVGENEPAALTLARPPASSIESREPRAESREPRAESREPRAESREPRAESREPRAESREPRAESREPRAESREPRAESREPRAESREPRAESREPRAESREPRAESREPSCVRFRMAFFRHPHSQRAADVRGRACTLPSGSVIPARIPATPPPSGARLLPSPFRPFLRKRSAACVFSCEAPAPGARRRCPHSTVTPVPGAECDLASRPLQVFDTNRTASVASPACPRPTAPRRTLACWRLPARRLDRWPVGPCLCAELLGGMPY